MSDAFRKASSANVESPEFATEHLSLKLVLFIQNPGQVLLTNANKYFRNLHFLAQGRVERFPLRRFSLQ